MGKEQEWKNKIIGPFFTGLSVRLSISEFAMRLNSPTSTSKQLVVATKFGGSKGMILTFDNGGSYQYQYLRCFNCCSLAAFPEEDECLFFGGYYRIKLVCLRLLATHQNFAQFARCCMYLDAMVTGGEVGDFELNKNDRSVIDNLLKHALNKQSLIEFDEY